MGLNLPEYQVKPQTRSLLRFLFKLRWIRRSLTVGMIIGFMVGLVATLYFGWWAALLAIFFLLAGMLWPAKR